MTKRLKKALKGIVIVLLFAAIVYTVVHNIQSEQATTLKVGDAAPNFSLTSLEGETITLSDYKGEGVLLNFWGTWCPPCKKEMPAFKKAYEKHHGAGFEMISINIAQSPLEVTQFLAPFEVDFPVVIDTKKGVMRAYGIDPLPTSIAIDGNGKIVQVITGEMSSEQINETIEKIAVK